MKQLKFKTMKKEFKTHGVHTLSNSNSLLIELSNCGETAKLKLSNKNNVGKWQQIKFNKFGNAYVTYYGAKYYLDEFLRVNY